MTAKTAAIPSPSKIANMRKYTSQIRAYPLVGTMRVAAGYA